MGAQDASLDAALTYSNLVFGGAVLIWLFNLLLATVRGTGASGSTRRLEAHFCKKPAGRTRAAIRRR
jgi:hypothetical protein